MKVLYIRLGCVYRARDGWEGNLEGTTKKKINKGIIIKKKGLKKNTRRVSYWVAAVL